jgi:DNA-binding winged helix-turn-helix (wHTH) protein
MELVLRASVRKKDQEERQALKTIQFGDITIDCETKTVRGPKGKKIISPIEIKVLANLAKANGSLMEKHSLKAKCWGQFGVTDNALHRKLHEIRAILKDVTDQVTIKSKYGSGFYLIFKARYKMAS